MLRIIEEDQVLDPFDHFEEQYKAAKEQAPPQLPAPMPYEEFENSPLEKPRSLVENLLDASSRMVFGGGSKTYKTWAMSDLAMSIASGSPWWNFKCFMCPVLYVNFELKPYYARERFNAIRKAKKLVRIPSLIWIWNLRDYNVSHCLNAFRDQTIEFILANSIAVIFLDPFYKLLGEHDERISSEIVPILNMFEGISHKTETSTVTAAHYTKGNQAATDPIDRISGGGIINRHPDSLLMLTKHETEGSFTIDTITRDFPPIDPFVVSWQYPLLVADPALDPTRIKVPRGRKEICDAQDLLELISTHDDQLSTSSLTTLAQEELNWLQRTVRRKLHELTNDKKIFKSKMTGYWNKK